jgi:hypothetical protein
VIEELIGRVFATRNAVHLAHWKTKSFANHMALGELYDALIDKIDTVVEMYQGAFELVGDVKPHQVSETDIVMHLNHEVEWIEGNMDDLSGGIKALENVLQDLSGAYYHAIYKLTNLS